MSRYLEDAVRGLNAQDTPLGKEEFEDREDDLSWEKADGLQDKAMQLLTLKSLGLLNEAGKTWLARYELSLKAKLRPRK